MGSVDDLGIHVASNWVATCTPRSLPLNEIRAIYLQEGIPPRKGTQNTKRKLNRQNSFLCPLCFFVASKVLALISLR